MRSKRSAGVLHLYTLAEYNNYATKSAKTALGLICISNFMILKTHNSACGYVNYVWLYKFDTRETKHRTVSDANCSVLAHSQGRYGSLIGCADKTCFAGLLCN